MNIKNLLLVGVGLDEIVGIEANEVYHTSSVGEGKKYFSLKVPDLVLLGVASGEAVRSIRELFKGPLVVFSDSRVVEALHAGADDFIIRPADPADVLAVVKNVMSRNYAKSKLFRMYENVEKLAALVGA